MTKPEGSNGFVRCQVTGWIFTPDSAWTITIIFTSQDTSRHLSSTSATFNSTMPVTVMFSWRSLIQPEIFYGQNHSTVTDLKAVIRDRWLMILIMFISPEAFHPEP